MATPDSVSATPTNASSERERAARFAGAGRDNAAWRAAGFSLTKDDPRMADDPVDAWLKPYERADGVRQAMADYLAWETDLLPRIAAASARSAPSVK